MVSALSKFKGTRMSNYVLVHGAWHGGWCWKRVSPLLRAAGHQVFTPTLTGLGERVHLISENIGLETHIKDVHAVLEFEDLRDVVLVGHSFAGMVRGHCGKPEFEPKPHWRCGRGLGVGQSCEGNNACRLGHGCGKIDRGDAASKCQLILRTPGRGRIVEML